MADDAVRLQIYVAPGGQKPFQEWIESVKDFATQGRILARIERVRLGLFGDSKTVGQGVWELRIDVGPGYRVYFGRDRASIALLLCGGNKATQVKDIAAAKTYWKDYKRRTHA